MDYLDREMIVNRILSGVFLCEVDNVLYEVKSPSKIDKYKADLLYKETLYRAMKGRADSEDAIHAIAKRHGFWAESDEVALKQLTDDIDNLKVAVYKNFYKNEVKDIRNKLNILRDGLGDLYMRKGEYMGFCDKTVASIAKHRYLLEKSLNVTDPNIMLLDVIMRRMRDEEVSDEQVREVARTDPWRSIWMSKDVCSYLFCPATSDLTVDQQRLIFFSTMYDRVYENPERPGDDIIKDDDALDGWQLDQYRERNKEVSKREMMNKIGNEKIANGQEVFLVVESDDQLRAVNEFNEPGARAVKRMREDQVNKNGEVRQENFIDERLLINEELRRNG